MEGHSQQEQGGTLTTGTWRGSINRNVEGLKQQECGGALTAGTWMAIKQKHGGAITT